MMAVLNFASSVKFYCRILPRSQTYKTLMSLN